MSREGYELSDIDGVRRLAQWWFDIEISDSDAKKISTLKNGRTGDVCSVGAVMWLKNRLAELSILPPAGHNGCPEVRLFCLLHMPSLEVSEEEIHQWQQRPNYARSKICRSPLARLEPIDCVAARMVHVPDETRCRCCGRYFRNAAAHRLHLAEVREEGEE